MKSVVLIIIAVLLLFSIRKYNDRKYNDKNINSNEYLNDIKNKKIYNKYIPNISVNYVDYKTLQGFHFTPQNKLHKGIIVCYGGSEGSPNFDKAKNLANKGYETLAVFMFGMKNQNEKLSKIPLEQFEDVLSYINKTIKPKETITLLGASKGAEYILNLATKYKEISNLILIAPSSYNFAGLDFENYGSSWSWKGKDLPFVDFKKCSFLTLLRSMIIPNIINSPICYKNIYDSSLKNDIQIKQKLIELEKVDCNILMIVGGKDEVWDSYSMSKIIKNSTKNSTIKYYKDAGHVFEGNGTIILSNTKIKSGGNIESNKKAELESEKDIDIFLKLHHK